MAKLVYTFIDPPSERDLSLAKQVLESGGVLAYPTDVNWAFGCDASNQKAIDKIRRLKPTHPKEQPFSLICSSISMAASIANIDHPTYRMLRKALPGPYTILLPSSRTLPKQLHEKRTTVGIRIPDSPLLLALVGQYGKPLATTSIPMIPQAMQKSSEAFAHGGSGMNDLSSLYPKFGYEVSDIFGHGLDLILDLGDEVINYETTVINLSEYPPTLIRQGVGDLALFDL